MDEAERLQQQIDYWQGLIDDHIQQQSHGSHGYSAQWTPHRGAPYGVRRGAGRSLRGGRGSFRHKSLVVNKATTGGTSHEVAPETPSTSSTPTADDFVNINGRHKQLINSNIYDRVTQQKKKDMDETWTARKAEKAAREAMRVQAYFARSTIPPGSQFQQVVVDGIVFRVMDNGSRLSNVSNHPVHLIPKRTVIGGVTFLRSKHGNLYRAGIVKSKLWVEDSKSQSGLLTRGRPTQKSKDLCPIFSSTGSCPQGPTCRFTHDPERVSICKEFLQKGTCSAGDYCDLSHQPSPHRTPACIHFLRGKCTNEECRYAHIRVSPGAPVCRAFATRGYCEDGSACIKRHVTECPDYANKGVCSNAKCRLPHVDRAGQLRKAATTTALSNDSTSPQNVLDDDVSSDEDDHPEDIDSDEDVFIQGIDGAGHDLTGNQDFIGF